MEMVPKPTIAAFIIANSPYKAETHGGGAAVGRKSFQITIS